MSLIEACTSFCGVTNRQELADKATRLVQETQTAIRDGVPNRSARSVIRAAAWARRATMDHALRDVRPGWARCETLALIETGPWDLLHLLLYLCQCHLRTCLARLFADNKGTCAQHWTIDVCLDEEYFVRLCDDEAQCCLSDLRAEVDPYGICSQLAATPFNRTVAAITVCLQGVVSVDRRNNDPLFNDTRPSRQGVRLLERHALAEDGRAALDAVLCAHELEDHVEASGHYEEQLLVWLQRTVLVDANNALLLRMDEWAMLCALSSQDVAFAVGEFGTVPQEHKNTPAAWVALQALPDERYRLLVKHAKQNELHPENIYIAFSGMLEQHYGFDWMTRCFVPRVDPVRACRKINEYLRSARANTPPLVVQQPDGCATVVLRRTDGIFRRVVCRSAAHALSAWISMVERHANGAYSRKANTIDIIERISNAPQVRALAAPKDIGGVCISVVTGPTV